MRTRSSLLFVLCIAAGCHDPGAGPPEIFNAAVNPISISAAEWLPDGIALTSDSSAFSLVLPERTLSQRITRCLGCTYPNRGVIPKPAFHVVMTTGYGLPSTVDSVGLTGGWIRLALSHTYANDPHRPAGGAIGTLEIRALSHLTYGNGPPENPQPLFGTELGRTTITGADQAFLPGTTTLDSIGLVGVFVGERTFTREISGMAVEFQLRSPAGDTVAFDIDAELRATITPTALRASYVALDSSMQDTTAKTFKLDTRSLAHLGDRDVKDARMSLLVDNPTGARGTISATLTGSGLSFIRQSDFADGESRMEFVFSPLEARSLLGRIVGVTLSIESKLTHPTTLTPRREVMQIIPTFTVTVD
jgi:hypothetical protein